MAPTIVVTQVLQEGLQIRWARLLTATLAVLVCLGLAGTASRWYLASTSLEYDLDERLPSLEVPSPHGDVVVFKSRDDAPSRPLPSGSTLERVKTERVLRVGYHPDHLPYSFSTSSST